MSEIHYRQLGSTIQLFVAVLLARATVSLWPGWWWPVTAFPTIWLAMGSILSFRSAWLIQWKG